MGDTTVQTSTLPDFFTGALQQSVGQTLGASQNPFQAYGGQLVAGFNPAQNQALGTAQGLAGYQPQQVTAGSVNPQQVYAPFVGGQDMSGYMNPYIGSVANSVQTTLNNRLAQQQQQNSGQATLSGAFGGDRAALVNQQATKDSNELFASTLSNLYNTGYTQAQSVATGDVNRALQAALANQSANLQGQTTNLNAGLQAQQLNQSAGLQGAGLNLNANQQAAGLGALQQQTDQNDLTAQYGQFQRSVQFPYQQSQFLTSGLSGLGGLASNMRTTSTTLPSPSTLSQLAGWGSIATGLLGGNNGLLSGLFGNGSSGSGTSGTGLLGSLGSGLSSAYNSVFGSGSSSALNANAYSPDASLYTDGYYDATSPLQYAADAGSYIGYRRGGRVELSGLAAYAYGGDVADQDAYVPVDAPYAFDPSQAMGAYMVGPDGRLHVRPQGLGALAASYGGRPLVNVAPPQDTGPPVQSGGFQANLGPTPWRDAAAGVALPDAPSLPRDDAADDAGAASTTVTAPAPADDPAAPGTVHPEYPVPPIPPASRGIGALASAEQPSGIAAASSPLQAQAALVPVPAARAASEGDSFDRIRLPLIAAGLGMLASKSPFASVGIGQGGLAGLQAYMQQRQADREQQRLDNQQQYQNALVGVRQGGLGVQQQNADTRTALSSTLANYREGKLADAQDRTAIAGQQADTAADLGQQRLAASRDRAAAQSDYRDARLGQIDRQQDQRDAALADRGRTSEAQAQLRANTIEDQAARALMFNNPRLAYSAAIAQVRQGRTAQGNAPVPGAGAAQAGPAVNDPLAQARAAIASGAPRAAVIQRLQQYGISPAGL